MLLSDLYQRLSYGPLMNLSMSNEGDGTIIDAKKPTVITHLNEGLLRLYSRFVLKENDIIIKLNEGIINYPLLPRYAQTNPDPGLLDTLFIQDTELRPFLGDVIRILKVADFNQKEYPLNDSKREDSLFTPQAWVLQFPFPTADKIIGVLYQAKHVAIAPNAPPTTEIILPEVLEGALVSFIASEIFSGMDSPESNAKSQAHLARFDAACVENQDRDLTNESISTTSQKFYDRGFV